MKRRIYVGHTVGNLYGVFESETEPTAETHGRFLAVIGPFRTMRGAQFMAKHGWNNPHLQTVADAERLAKKGE